MSLHRAERSDWGQLPPEEYNQWQRLAAKTRGVVTPGNVISLIGAGLVLYGLYLITHDSLGLGLTLIVIGRLADILDGLVADYTRTKSPLGELVDAVADKLVIALALLVLLTQELLPLLVGLVLAAQSVYNSTLSAIAKVRQTPIHPSLAGKLGTFFGWGTIALYLLAELLERHAYGLANFTFDLAWLCFWLFAIIGGLSSFNYTRQLYRKTDSEVGILPSYRFDNCLVVLNPASTHSTRSLHMIEELKLLFPGQRLDIIETSKGGSTHNIRLAARLGQLEKNSLLCVAGGDGTISLVVNLLLRHPDMPVAARSATILPLWGGNANDFAYMINGPAAAANVSRIIKEGVAARIHPLHIKLAHEQETRTKLAVCYVSFGASAYATHLISQPVHRQRRIYFLVGTRIIYEVLAFLKALVHSKTFAIKLDGSNRTIYDLIIVNGSRIAKMYRTPVNIIDKHFYEVTMVRKHPLFVAYFSKIIYCTLFKKESKTMRSLTIEDVAWSQIDGEVRRVSGQTTVSIKPHVKDFKVLSTKLAV